MKPHKHAAIIKAWADGATIECKRHELDGWNLVTAPNWHEEFQYRIKPETEPDVIGYFNLYPIHLYDTKEKAYSVAATFSKGVICVTLDGETGKLKAAEVLK